MSVFCAASETRADPQAGEAGSRMWLNLTKFVGKLRTVLKWDGLFYSHPWPSCISSHCTKRFQCIIITHYTLNYIKYTIALQSPPRLPVQDSYSDTGALLVNIETPLWLLLLFCCFSHKSQFSSPSWASLRPLLSTPSPPQPTTLPQPPRQGVTKDLGGRALCGRWASPLWQGKSEAQPSCPHWR